MPFFWNQLAELYKMFYLSIVHYYYLFTKIKFTLVFSIKLNLSKKKVHNIFKANLWNFLYFISLKSQNVFSPCIILVSAGISWRASVVFFSSDLNNSLTSVAIAPSSRKFAKNLISTYFVKSRAQENLFCLLLRGVLKFENIWWVKFESGIVLVRLGAHPRSITRHPLLFIFRNFTKNNSMIIAWFPVEKHEAFIFHEKLCNKHNKLKNKCYFIIWSYYLFLSNFR